MSRQPNNFEMFRGDDLRVLVEVRDADGQLVDISNAQEIEWQLARDQGSTPDSTKTLSGGGITISNSTTFSFDITASETSALSGSYYHEAEVLTSQGNTYTALSGRVYFRRDLV